MTCEWILRGGDRLNPLDDKIAATLPVAVRLAPGLLPASSIVEIRPPARSPVSPDIWASTASCTDSLPITSPATPIAISSSGASEKAVASQHPCISRMMRMMGRGTPRSHIRMTLILPFDGLRFGFIHTPGSALHGG